MNTHVARKLAWMVVLVALWCVKAAAQQNRQSSAVPTQPDIATAMSKAQGDGRDSINFVEQLAQAGAVKAVPMLENKFAHTNDPIDKAHVASALVRLGDNDGAYWDYLEEQARRAIANGAPDILQYDDQGKPVKGLSPDFTAWAKAHNLTPEQAAGDQMYRAPIPIFLLGLTGDKRAVPLLRLALSSPNHQIEIFAALGLAQLGDSGSVPLIVEACRKAPADVAATMAQALVYFDDPEAQKGVEQYMSKQNAEIHRQARARGAKPLGK